MSTASLPPDPLPPNVTFVLECLECRCRSEEARGWHAYLYEDSELFIYCASCAAREFAE